MNTVTTNFASDAYPRHERAAIRLLAPASDVFAWADDHANLTGHMSQPSMRMGGGSIAIRVDAGGFRSLGSVLSFNGKAFGLPLDVSEAVVAYQPPARKVWETTREPMLWAIGRYRMGFEAVQGPAGTDLQVFIDYALPARHVWLGRLLGRSYARWCVRRMVADAGRKFTTTPSG